MFFNMGVTLSQPITEKHSETYENAHYMVAVSSMQGWRVSMEDSHSVYLELPGDPSASFFAVYDGHSGPRVAEYASENLHKYIVSSNAYHRGSIKEAIKESFLELDGEMRVKEEFRDDMSGSTAIVILIKNNVVYCANLGDSRAIAVVNGNVHALSIDHKPNLPSEYERIVEAGGWVEVNRVNGNLAVSRAFGDFIYKTNNAKDREKQAIIAVPDINESRLSSDWDFLLLACDGIWDVLTCKEVSDFVLTRLKQGKSPRLICEDLLSRCLSPVSNYGGTGCDNMTVILVLFMNNKRNHQLYKTQRSESPKK